MTLNNNILCFSSGFSDIDIQPGDFQDLDYPLGRHWMITNITHVREESNYPGYPEIYPYLNVTIQFQPQDEEEYLGYHLFDDK